MDDLPRTRLYRFLEIMPGAIAWSILLVPIIAAVWFPRAVAIFVMMYLLLWFLRYMKSSVFFVYSFFKSKYVARQNWPHLLTELEKKGGDKSWEDIYHVVIIATYKEEKDILAPTLESLTEIDFPLERMIVVLATEERDRERAEANAEYLTQKFAHRFGQFHHIMHPKNLPGEIAGKGANISYAGKHITAHLKKMSIDPSNVLVTTLDADNRPHQSYFSCLTHAYLIEPDRKKRSYQPLTFFYNNIWDVPFINRVIAIANTFWYLSECGESDRLFNASAHAQSLDALIEMDFWSKETIVEDIHQFWRAFFHFKGNHIVVPLFIPVYQDALQNKTYFTSLVGQYKQLRRWAWGASEIPYALIKTWKMRRELPIYRTISMLWYLCFLQITWSTAPIIIYFNKSIPSIANPVFAQSLFAYNLGQVINILFTVVFFAVLLFLSMSLLSVPRPTGKFKLLKYGSILIQWLLIPFVTILYGAIPAIDAQTRLMLNKPLGFVVTEKIRKIN